MLPHAIKCFKKHLVNILSFVESGSAICTFFMSTMGCSKSTACPYRHVRGEKTVVCKHWLRGLCKKGDECEFLHEFDMTKMPECFFFSKYGIKSCLLNVFLLTVYITIEVAFNTILVKLLRV